MCKAEVLLAGLVDMADALAEAEDPFFEGPVPAHMDSLYVERETCQKAFEWALLKAREYVYENDLSLRQLEKRERK